MENAPDIKSKSVDFVQNDQKFICCRLVVFDISKGQNLLVAPVLYQNTPNLMSIISLADLNLNVSFYHLEFSKY